MMSAERIALYDKIEAHIPTAIQLVEKHLPSDALAAIETCLAHNEPGLAFEAHIGSAREGGWRIDERAGFELDAALMELDAGQWR